MTRRELFKLTAIVATTTIAEASINKVIKNNKSTLLLKKSPRVVIVGGGWSGLSVAKNLKYFAPQTDVVLVEQKEKFVSCPMSNFWLVDKVDLQYLTYDYLKAAREYNYTFFQATAIDMDKKNKILHTSNGDIKYDYILFAPGIDYDYSFLTDDIKIEQELREKYPAGFKPGKEHIILKNKILNFKKGNFIMTVPAGNYRCLPAPYERACVVADYFKSKKLKAKVILLDENNDITIKEHGFHTAFDELYSDYLEYHPNSKIESIDLEEKFIETEFEEFYFDDASFYPRVRGGKILEKVGIAKDTVFNRLEGNIDEITYEVKGEKDIFISGDARPMGFSKSGNTSNTEGIYVAKLIANKINKQSNIKWESPTTLCYSAVSINPIRSISIVTQYKYNKKKKRFGFDTPITDEIWKGKKGKNNAQYQFNWADAMFVDMFGGELT